MAHGLKINVDTTRLAPLTTFLRRMDSPQMEHAARRGLTEHIRVQEKDSVTTVAAQTKIPSGRVASVTRSYVTGGGQALQGIVEVKDSAIPLGQYTYRQWSRSSAGATAGDWNTKLYRRSFTVAAYGGRVFTRAGKARGPLVPLSGPVLANELGRKDMPNLPQREAFAARDLEQRVLRNMLHAFGF